MASDSHFPLPAARNFVSTEDRSGAPESSGPNGAERNSLGAGGGKSIGEQINVSRISSGIAIGPAGLLQYVRPLYRWWWLILISAIVGVVSGYLGAHFTPPVYQSKTTLMVGQALQNPNPDTSQLATGQVLAQSYADLVRREPVLKSTLNTLGLKWDWTVLRGMVSSRVIEGTQLLEISVLDNDPQRASILANEIAQQLILQSPTVSDPERDAETQFVQGEIEELKANIQKSRAEISQLREVIAKSNSARQIQDAQARQASLQTQITTWEATYAQLLTSLQKGTPNFLSIMEPAQTPLTPVSPGAGFTVVLGLAMGLVFSSGAAFLLEYIDDTLKTQDDVRETLGLLTLGRLPRFNSPKGSSKLVTIDQTRSPVASAYRVLRTNLQFYAIDRSLNTLIITSAGPKEGKSTVAANLAATMAQAGQRVILVDADLWRPTQHLIFDLDTQVGLTNVLMDEAKLDEVLQATPLELLRVLPAGPLPPNPADLLGSRRMSNLITALREHADKVIFDTPPIMVDADAVIMAARMDGVIFVVDAGHTRRALARRCQEALNTVGARLAGVALNGVREPAKSYDYYYSTVGPQRGSRSRLSQLAALFNLKHKKKKAGVSLEAIKEPRLEPQLEPESELSPEPALETRPRPELKPTPEPQLESETELSLEPALETRPQPELKTAPEPQLESETELSLEPTLETKPQPELKPTPEPQPKLEIKPKPRQETKPQSEMRLGMRPEPGSGARSHFRHRSRKNG